MISKTIDTRTPFQVLEIHFLDLKLELEVIHISPFTCCRKQNPLDVCKSTMFLKESKYPKKIDRKF
jgi:hypothetical protein